uniref:Hexosyltransferase n=1 Tax=Ditylenchus dipsaci TaxID=166011 RepID=A0A915D238_9BILA
MIYGLRSFLPFGLGVLSSVLFAFFFFDNNASQRYNLKCAASKQASDVSSYIFSSKDWKVNKVVRARFAATELGIREKCIVIVLSQSSLSLAINGYLSPHVSRIQFFADASRIDAEMSSLPNLTPLHFNGQHSHSHILNSIFNMTFHENYDFMLFIPETTYVNPFALNRFVEQINWNNPQAFGYDDSGKCILKSGILLSNPAVQLLIQERHLCNSISASTDELALEMCIHHATNLSCSLLNQNSLFRWWHEESSESGSAIHDRIPLLSLTKEFNLSLTVSPLLSEMDARLLHKHFVTVEMNRLDVQVEDLTGSLVGFTQSTENELSWPVGLPPLSKPPNRYQVPVWEYFTQTKIFKNNPNQNVVLLAGDDALDVNEVVKAARSKVEVEKYSNAQFIRLRSGYRIFNAVRGMEYVVDLEYRSFGTEAKFLRRVWLCRPIYSTRLLNSVPYVKEDTDITIVIGIESLEQVRAASNCFKDMIGGCICSPGIKQGLGGVKEKVQIMAHRHSSPTTQTQQRLECSGHSHG